jgi:hypothetical protein
VLSNNRIALSTAAGRSVLMPTLFAGFVERLFNGCEVI